MWSAHCQELSKILQEILQKTWGTEEIPNESGIKLPKKGDLAHKTFDDKRQCIQLALTPILESLYYDDVLSVLATSHNDIL